MGSTVEAQKLLRDNSVPRRPRALAWMSCVESTAQFGAESWIASPEVASYVKAQANARAKTIFRLNARRPGEGLQAHMLRAGAIL